MDIRSLINPTPPSRVSTPSNAVPNDGPRKRKRTPLPASPSKQTSQRPRRKRHDPIPIWAIREGDMQPHAPPIQAPVQDDIETDDAPEPALEPSITNITPYDEITRSVCDFIWQNVVMNSAVRRALAESPDTQVEIEAKWGQMQDKRTGERFTGVHQTECVVDEMDLGDSIKFVSTMSEAQHQKMNKFLNGCVTDAKGDRIRARAPLDYKHVKEIDKFFELNHAGFEILSPATKALLQTFLRKRVRLSRDMKTGRELGKIIKHRIANLHISSPKTEWDYRVSINLEINYPRAVNDLEPAAESGLPQERKKDRMSYTHQNTYQIDLTQVVNESGVKNHELELELYGDMLVREADKINQKLPSTYEGVVGMLVNNLRVLSRAI
ncbi:mRNA triphosphatase CET1 [Mytilinidion resinicola]|uniref:mRNA-capping enzyme subunit beta n=1 Tax=Mytilinidion resinicola TaxID=574789 RepID=A0A6A6Z0F7_9PEZI|nr:mRNA triphosphatase CET1 [Mytilinidion resinicola]KAF2814652.1 mRNA triphosphatase CET1 [Mytilinidion resinicola]